MKGKNRGSILQAQFDIHIIGVLPDYAEMQKLRRFEFNFKYNFPISQPCGSSAIQEIMQIQSFS